ncbi:MAG: tyrosine-type recombinase/integrase [Phycisphaeraceae bacterium]|nr:tyrosine-type recombinase/integrase [Phycisphaeraceae bacterium]MCB9848147.1 tyrosine-type recombinase/integrase [Phycisphaeraceae bacterium]
MKYEDQETVHGTRVTIGRRVQHRKVRGERIERISKNFTAEFMDIDGVRRIESLGTPIKREARKLATEIQAKLDEGRDVRRRRGPVTIEQLIAKYTAYAASKGLAHTSLAKYRADLEKLAWFCAELGVVRADRFDEPTFQAYGAWLREQRHKQGLKYSAKTVLTAMTLCLQCFRWAWRTGLMPEYRLVSARLPWGRPRSQPCFTTEQVEALLDRTTGITHAAIALGGYAGLRVGEIQQLRWTDVRLDRGKLGVLHIQRGGSAGTTKDKDPRFVPIHPRVRAALDALERTDPLVLPGLSDRTLLGRIKRLCRELGYDPRLKTHSLRHHFASYCAASARVPYRMALAWMGHSSSQVLDLYYHLHDEDSEAAMQTLAGVHSLNRDRGR